MRYGFNGMTLLVRFNSFDQAAQALIEAAATEDPRVMGSAFKEMTKSCKSCHQQFRED